MNILDKLPDQSKKDLKKLWDIFPDARLFACSETNF